jgi:hypothetical protein
MFICVMMGPPRFGRVGAPNLATYSEWISNTLLSDGTHSVLLRSLSPHESLANSPSRDVAMCVDVGQLDACKTLHDWSGRRMLVQRERSKFLPDACNSANSAPLSLFFRRNSVLARRPPKITNIPCALKPELMLP